MEVSALRLHGVDDLRLERVSLRDPQPGDVVATVDACGVCGSDLHFLDGTARTAYVPITLGHEIAATVVESRDDSWTEGDPVLVAAGTHCGTCSRCVAGRENLCEHALVAGVSMDGGWSQAITIRGSALIHRPADIPVDAAASAMDAGVTAYHATARRGGVGEGDTVAIIGIGGLGTFGAQIAKALGAAPVVAIDNDPIALVRATHYGADETVQAREGESVGRAVKMLTDGGVDVAVEFVGLASTVDAAIKTLRPGGVAVVAGVGTQPLVTLPPVLWATHEYELRGAFGGLPGDAERVLSMMRQGAVRPPPMRRVALDAAAEAIIVAAQQGGMSERLVVVP